MIHSNETNYEPEIDDYVIWNRPNGDIEEGWVYFKGDPVDNEKRSKEIVNRIEKAIDRGYEVVIWPSSLQEKDLNDMFSSGHDVQSMVEFNPYRGLEAKIKLSEWKKV